MSKRRHPPHVQTMLATSNLRQWVCPDPDKMDGALEIEFSFQPVLRTIFKITGEPNKDVSPTPRKTPSVKEEINGTFKARCSAIGKINSAYRLALTNPLC
ncbi:MAG: hypothetical protein V3U54_06135, partial [Thermodesulfobacteriota bacterium]